MNFLIKFVGFRVFCVFWRNIDCRKADARLGARKEFGRFFYRVRRGIGNLFRCLREEDTVASFGKVSFAFLLYFVFGRVGGFRGEASVKVWASRDVNFFKFTEGWFYSWLDLFLGIVGLFSSFFVKY